jgi:dihydropyrimidinase
MHCELDEEVERLRDQYISEGKTSPRYHPLSRPNYVEADAVKKAIELANQAECPLYIVHVSTKEAIEHIRRAQITGQKVYAETCPQYLLLDDSLYDQEFDKSCKYVMSPPLRKKEDQQALWQAIQDGVIVNIGTDHCPFTLAQKKTGLDNFTKIPNGAGGVEHRMSLLYQYGVLQNRISIEKFVEITSKNAAKIFGYENKGKIKEGYDADLVIWDSTAKAIISSQTHIQNCDLNIYEGFHITGKPIVTILNGKIKTNGTGHS